MSEPRTSPCATRRPFASASANRKPQWNCRRSRIAGWTSMRAPTENGLLSTRGIHKRFPGVHALKGVSLDVRRGEVHALVGENGAGKSTLMHLLAGVYQPDEGRIDFDGCENIRIADEHAAQRLGIAIVFQERSLFGDLTVAENVFAARQPVGKWGHIKRRELLAQARFWLEQAGVDISRDALVCELSPAQQQMVEIAKALSLRARLII